MKKKKKLLVLLLFAQITFAQTSWVKIETQFEPAGTYHFYDGEFFDQSNAWALDRQNKKILNTRDGGLTWQVKYDVPKYFLWNIFKLNENIGWIIYEKEDTSAFLKTIDGGSSWEKTLLPFDTRKFYFVDEDNGFSIGDTNNFYKTIDGGESWDKMEIVLPDTSLMGQDVFFLNKNTGWILASYGTSGWVGDLKMYLFSTNDGGKNWNIHRLSDKINQYGLSKIVFIDSLNGVATSLQGSHYTFDCGNSWAESNGEIISSLDLIFTSNNIGWSVGDRIYTTIDSGKTWTSSYTNNNQPYLNAVSFINNSLGYVFGAYGTLLKYDNTVGIDDYSSEKAIDKKLFLESYPNPANSLTNIFVTLPESSFIQLKIYNVNGEFVKTIYTGFLSQGKHSFKLGLNELSSGLYICNLQQNNSSKSIKILLLK